MSTINRLGACIGAALAVATMAPHAQAQSVHPVVVDLQPAGRRMSQIVTVENTSERPMPVEIRIEEIALDAAGPRGTGRDPGDLAVFPAQAMIAPGERQVFRVQYVGEPDQATSRHYYLTVAQLPVEHPNQVSSIQLLYNVQVMVSVAPRDGRPALEVRSAGIGADAAGHRAPVIEVANPSVTHGYLSDGALQIVERDASGREVGRRSLSGAEIRQTIGYGLVGAGQTRRVMLPAALSPEGTSVDVRFIPQSTHP